MKLLLTANTDWFLYNYRLSQARFMREQGYTVELVSPPGPYVESLRAEGFTWHAWPVDRQSMRPWEEAGAVLRLAHIFRHTQADLVHAFTLKAALYSGLAALLPPRPRIVAGITGRGHLFHSDSLSARLARVIAIPFLRLAFNRARCAGIFENDLDRDDFIRRGIVSPGQSFLIPGAGADTARFTPAPEPPGPAVILFAGRLLWEKGPGDLIEAGRILRGRGLTFRLALAGQTDPGNPGTLDEADLSAWQAAGEAEWWGFQPRIEEAFRRAHILVLPTYYGEGAPTVLMEAAAAGLPIVASDHPGCAQVVCHEENGLLVPPRDPAALAKALERLIGDAALRLRMGQAGRKRVEDKLSQVVISRQTLGVYLNLGCPPGGFIGDKTR
jgi:glycosyltransferase involved in cell wall biosynthesis